MAVRFDAGGDLLRLASGAFDYNSPYTYMGWWKLSVANTLGVFQAIQAGTSGTANADFCGTTSGGLNVRVQARIGDVGSSVNGSAIGLGVWAHLALVRESATSLKLYLNGALDVTDTRDITGRIASTSMSIGGSYNTGGPVDGTVSGLKVWTRQLTSTQILAEMLSARPVSFDNIWAWWPMVGDRTRDYGGEHHDWTEFGTLSDEPGYPQTFLQSVAWSHEPVAVSAPTDAELLLGRAAGLGAHSGQLDEGLALGRVAALGMLGEPVEGPRASVAAVGGAEYKLIIRDRCGPKLAEIVDFWWLGYSKRLLYPDVVKFQLSERHHALEHLHREAQVEVWRRNPRWGIPWYCDSYSLFQEGEWQEGDYGIFTGTALGSLDLLDQRIVAYPAGTTGRSEFRNVNGETLMKTLVQFNATDEGTTADGRLTPAGWQDRTFLIEQDQLRGEMIESYGCAYNNLLETLRAVAAKAGGEFDLLKVGAAIWEFRFYRYQRGRDLTQQVTFSTSFGNMVQPRYRRRYSDERTLAIVGGGGERLARAVRVVPGPNYQPALHSEVFIDKRDTTDPRILYKAGELAMSEMRAKDSFTFRVLQTASSAYGRDYCAAGEMGDLVMARYREHARIQKLVAIDVEFSPQGAEAIDVETEDA